MGCQLTKTNTKPAHVFTYSPPTHRITTEKAGSSNGSQMIQAGKTQLISLPDVGSDLKVHLPRFRNRVDLYTEDTPEKGLIASVHLGTAGFTRNLQRNLGRDYTVLQVKGGKSEK